MAIRDIVVIGASAGGVEAITSILAGLPADLPAALFVVVHTATTNTGMLAYILGRACGLVVKNPTDGEPVRHGHVYVAPPDHHMTLAADRIVVRRGPRENGFRPAVDPLFRTAAQAFGTRVVGIILSGGLSDGTDGLLAVRRAGGLTMVQDPDDAAVRNMPESALANVDVDYVVPARQIPALIEQVVRERRAGRNTPKPRPRAARAGPEMEGGKAGVDARGLPLVITCPDCGGALAASEDGNFLRFRCHVGHRFSADGLDEARGEQVEAALWSAIRALKERAKLHEQMAVHANRGRLPTVAARYAAAARHALADADRIHAVLLGAPGEPAPMMKQRATRRRTTRTNARSPTARKA